MTWFLMIVCFVLGYALRHYDVLRIHFDPFATAYKKAQQAKAQEQAEKIVAATLKK